MNSVIKIKFVPIVIAAALMTMTNAAQAADSPIDFQGRLIEQTCTIKVDGAVTPVAATVTLPTVSVSSLKDSWSTSYTGFEIELSDCAGAAATAAAFFEAGADVNPVLGHLINRGSAKNVHLLILDNSRGGAYGYPIKVGDPQQVSFTSRVTLVGGNAILPYRVRYVSHGATTAGTVSSSVTYSINYQ